jgi:2-oxo-4-hydroxy-4-carboxy--5-ureidoimidazoline (OHCU) decarboxylase
VSRTAAAEAFERAPLLAERVGEGDPEVVLGRARALIATMTESERIAVLDAHPQIGATAGLSARSAAEQRVSEATDAATLEALKRLNAEYERRFGFRFVVFVAGRSRDEIVPVLKSRLRRSREEELATGLEEFLAIARDRLEK